MNLHKTEWTGGCNKLKWMVSLAKMGVRFHQRMKREVTMKLLKLREPPREGFKEFNNE